jgi:hypothetical protein
MQLGKDSCACAHALDHHDGGRGGPCNYCGCGSGQSPTAFEAGVIQSLNEITMTLMRLVKEIQSQKGTGS